MNLLTLIKWHDGSIERLFSGWIYFMERTLWNPSNYKIVIMSMTDQLKCKIHTDEFITNYCIRGTWWEILENCGLELCATCICEHTQFHNNNNTKPEYQNIKETHNITLEALGKCRETLNKEKGKIVHLLLSRETSLKISKIKGSKFRVSSKRQNRMSFALWKKPLHKFKESTTNSFTNKRIRLGCSISPVYKKFTVKLIKNICKFLMLHKI